MSTNESMYLTTERYLAALRRLRQRIEEGVSLVSVDSVEIGNKYTHCSWGLCSSDKEAWPDAEDHLFPEEFRSGGRVSPLYRTHGQVCPLDRNLFGDPWGCFFRCRVFRSSEPAMSKELVLRLFGKVIGRAERRGQNGS